MTWAKIKPGDRFGRLVAVEPVTPPQSKWHCVCDCGTAVVIPGGNLRRAKAPSCGCAPRVVERPAYAEKACVVCGHFWTPSTSHQAARNETCGIECRGELIAVRRGRTDAETLDVIDARSIPLLDGCVVWSGPLSPDGYARVGHQGAWRMAHRVAYELRCGPIAFGHQIDHLCRKPSCVNVAHLEPVTQQENLRREWLARKAAAA